MGHPSDLIAEVDLDINLNGDRLFALSCGFETPLLHCLDSLLIQTVPKTLLDFNVMWASIRTDDHPQHDCPLYMGPACFPGVLRVGSGNNSRCGYCASNTEYRPLGGIVRSGVCGRLLGETYRERSANDTQ